jgi:hypothetical protein
VINEEDQRMSERSRRWWLCLPPIVFCFTDHVLTMCGQPLSYWQGELNETLEANPVADAVFRQGHFYAHLLPVAWVILFSTVILWVPRQLALLISVSITFAHAFCACTWFYFEGEGYYLTLGVCLTCAALVTYSVDRWHPWTIAATNSALPGTSEFDAICKLQPGSYLQPQSIPENEVRSL